MTRVKICGLTNAHDVVAALEFGADACGFVLEPSSPRCITLESLEELCSLCRPYATPVAVFGRAKSQVDCARAVQAVHFDLEPQLWQDRILAVQMSEGVSPEEVVQRSQGSTAVVLDAYSPKAFGGTGQKVDWGAARAIKDALSIPLILAGGLTPENVARAVQVVEPYAVDVSSGVEQEGRTGVKEVAKMRDFIQAARGA